ncbi:hypothetical protein [Lujinxingia litoralis]|uniref:hypothetical protein n=1 Tax=Lujinxingia litoralis TaxID=2211119 RepID=UPI001314A12B|nr:hypothetical protein [Lujinxingia litoralis]
MQADWIHVYVVFRIDNYLKSKSLEHKVTIKEVLPTAENAEKETARLNELVEPGVYYFWQSAKYYPNGRGVE